MEWNIVIRLSTLRKYLEEDKNTLIMEIKGKVHCFFEQSGTFKNEFIK